MRGLKTKAITWGALSLWGHKVGAVQLVGLKIYSLSLENQHGNCWLMRARRDGVALAKPTGASRTGISEGGELLAATLRSLPIS